MPQSLVRRNDPPVATAPISVAIIDDSAVARAALGRAIEGEATLRLAATFSGADQAISWLGSNPVDVILLDLEMPGRDGLAALPDLISSGSGAQVLIVSSAAREGAEATLKALSLGAADTLTKPSAGQLHQAFGTILVDRVRKLGRARAQSFDQPFALRAPSTEPVALLAIGASTGGIRAIDEFFSVLPRNFHAPIVVTQHLPATFMPFFAEQLSAMAGRFARVAVEGETLVAGEILVAPGSCHLTIERRGTQFVVRLRDGDVPSRCCPSVDPMFSSVAEAAGKGATAVVLAGMGRDGADGAARIVDCGGSVIAQDRVTSAVWGMPGCVARAGLASLVAPPADLARHLVARGAA